MMDFRHTQGIVRADEYKVVKKSKEIEFTLNKQLSKPKIFTDTTAGIRGLFFKKKEIVISMKKWVPENRTDRNNK